MFLNKVRDSRVTFSPAEYNTSPISPDSDSRDVATAMLQTEPNSKAIQTIKLDPQEKSYPYVLKETAENYFQNPEVKEKFGITAWEDHYSKNKIENGFYAPFKRKYLSYEYPLKADFNYSIYTKEPLSRTDLNNSLPIFIVIQCPDNTKEVRIYANKKDFQDESKELDILGSLKPIQCPLPRSRFAKFLNFWLMRLPNGDC